MKGSSACVNDRLQAEKGTLYLTKDSDQRGSIARVSTKPVVFFLLDMNTPTTHETAASLGRL